MAIMRHHHASSPLPSPPPASLPSLLSPCQRLRRRRLAAWLREAILDLGPTFIKLGQLFSSRSDLLPAEFVEELSKLQVRLVYVIGVYAPMDEWMDGWTDGRMDGWTDGWMHGWIVSFGG